MRIRRSDPMSHNATCRIVEILGLPLYCSNKRSCTRIYPARPSFAPLCGCSSAKGDKPASAANALKLLLLSSLYASPDDLPLGSLPTEEVESRRRDLGLRSCDDETTSLGSANLDRLQAT